MVPERRETRDGKKKIEKKLEKKKGGRRKKIHTIKKKKKKEKNKNRPHEGETSGSVLVGRGRGCDPEHRVLEGPELVAGEEAAGLGQQALEGREQLVVAQDRTRTRAAQGGGDIGITRNGTSHGRLLLLSSSSLFKSYIRSCLDGYICTEIYIEG